MRIQRYKVTFFLVLAGLVLVFGSGLWLATASPAKAQCGSQASSCKNCHEVQAEMPVNADGTSWHQSHAFGDFCYLCHAGNNQAMDKSAAHEGMVAPLSDVQAACQQCHVADLQERALVYATTLGVEIGAGSAEQTSGGGVVTAPADTVSAPSVPVSQECNSVVVDDPNLVDYARNYDEIVLGKKPINWGNMILIGMIGMLIVGGGGLVVTHEKLAKVSFGDTKKVEGEYPAEVVDILPAIAGLKSSSRKSLKNVLANPQKADKLLGLMDAVISDEKSEEEL
jgi:hypothetical protein